MAQHARLTGTHTHTHTHVAGGDDETYEQFAKHDDLGAAADSMLEARAYIY